MKISHDDEKKKPIEFFPFRVEVASEKTISKITALRAAAYGRHMPEFAAKLMQPEESDYDIGCEVFVAVSKLDGSALGTFRTHSNVYKPLPLEASLELDDRFDDARLVETTRLSIAGGGDSSMVRIALFKTLYLYCMQQRVDWMLAAGRRPVDKMYDGLLFKDVNERGVYYPMSHAAGVPHRVMFLAPSKAKEVWAEKEHPLFDYAFETSHPDIDLSGVKNLDLAWRGISKNAFDISQKEGENTRSYRGSMVA